MGSIFEIISCTSQYEGNMTKAKIGISNCNPVIIVLTTNYNGAGTKRSVLIWKQNLMKKRHGWFR